MNGDLLKGEIRAKAMTQGDAAKSIGISLSRFNAKINNSGGAEFSVAEIRGLKKLLELSAAQVDAIFFA